jgi:NADPH:quinone reductase-like Zn-dependent oxidoreductase
MPWLATGEVSMRIDSSFPLAQIAEAHARLEGNQTIGKVAISFD